MSDTRYIGRSAGTGAPAGKRKRTLYLVGGGVGIIAAWYIIQRRKASAAIAATDPNADPNATDPSLSGLDTGSSPALSSYTDPATGAIISGGGWSTGPGSGPTQTITAPTSNAQWAQQAIAYLSQTGFDPVSISLALGKYLANQNLADDELGMVQAAISVEGQPPNPPVLPPHVAPPAGQTSTATVTQSVTKPKTPGNAHVASHKKGVAVLAWNAEVGANEYRLHFDGVPVRMVKGTTATVHRNGKWRVASVRGAYTSPYSPVMLVKGI